MSDKPTLLITRKLSDAVEARAARDYDVRLNLEDQLFSPQELLDKCQTVDAVLPCHSEIFSRDVVVELPRRLKIIANHSVGTDHCDLAALGEKGVVVTNTPDVLSDATAEIAFLLMLGAARRASEGDRMMRAGAWDFWSPAFMVGTQTTGKRLGIIGMGRVGQVMAQRGRGFDMEIHYYNRKRLAPDKEQGATYHENVEDLLPHCDVLSLHCPTTPETTGMMNNARFDLLPDGAIFVNTARGALVDENALIKALSSGKVAAAGLDVFQTEPGGNPKLSKLENIFQQPHIGSATFDTRNAMGFRALDNLDAFFAGNKPKDRVA
ncbi:MAG: D-glycerate dehydrogenase [Rhodospirillaceae bacterium]|jgi:lactate dehydrogenase-like 2-hydroxyacid dehydrogenase|nr:D-glycerate dehydrogenase [Rhodospirillaceae bacterium]MBT5297444.1 D-glycerate dehydrogenase [Rhodospirillaceae bacterium]MBT5514858.1 D-glycerate dehydrogenase [Rhodospirillaceae bacterium]MBT6609563.1 D-glycerate dehydrogenase [Rhodospirillaceae bacterium]MBT7249139.1 D-glycerate dehydrogenase [Rhodospirillaceae bacterium]